MMKSDIMSKEKMDQNERLIQGKINPIILGEKTDHPNQTKQTK